MAAKGLIQAKELEGKGLIANCASVLQVVHALGNNNAVYMYPGDVVLIDDIREFRDQDFFAVSGNEWATKITWKDIDGKKLAMHGGYKIIKGNLEKAPYDREGKPTFKKESKENKPIQQSAPPA